MSNDSFSNKEMLQQLMVDIRDLRSLLSDHKDLITQQSSLNQGRDAEIANLATNMREMNIEMRTMRADFDEKIGDIRSDYSELDGQFTFFKYKITLIIGAISTIGAFLLSRVFDYAVTNLL